MEPVRLQWPPGFDPRRFLAEVWQRRPMLLRDALPGITSPITPDELAGLACEPEVEARIVREQDLERPWQVSHGPFDEAAFAQLPATNWTLLVQDVDKHVPAVAAVLAAFDFLPEWRLEDIMVSWAEDGGSVGPHMDEYDVFLVQMQGRRRWRIDSRPDPPAAMIPDLDLRILERFEPDRDWILGPGDVLYLPPGVPHWGTADGPCMTWSVGLRAPAWRELAADWLQHAVDTLAADGRWRDPPGMHPPLEPAALPADVTARMRERIEAFMDGADDQLFRRWLGTYLTEPKPNIVLLPPEPPWPAQEVLALLLAQGRLLRDGASRLLFLPAAGSGDEDLIFANGDCHALPAGHAGFLAALCHRPALEMAAAAPWLDEPRCIQLLTTLFNSGHFLTPDDASND